MNPAIINANLSTKVDAEFVCVAGGTSDSNMTDIIDIIYDTSASTTAKLSVARNGRAVAKIPFNGDREAVLFIGGYDNNNNIYATVDCLYWISG